MDGQRIDAIGEALRPRYLVERELGRGGMATVYLGLDTVSDERVAIKVLHEDLTSTVGVDRFTREIRLTMRLLHPHVLPVLASGSAGGLAYYVMPHVQEGSLRERLERDKVLPIDEAIAITTQVAAALDAAHRQGIVHRDVKPGNIFLAPGGALVADFGIARIVDALGEERLTESGLVIGTAGYMSPEQAGGERRIDGRSDLYGLACVLFEMLTGEPPYTGTTKAAIFAKQLSLNAPSARTVRETVPSALDAAIRKGLAKFPEDRFRNAREFAAAIEAAAHAEGGSLWAPQRRTARRAAWAAGAGMIALTALGVWSLVQGASDPAAALDPMLFAIFPFEAPGSVALGARAGRLAQDALGRWTDLGVVDPLRLREALEREGVSTPSPSDAARVSRELGAGRYVRGDITPVGDSLRIHAVLGDAASDARTLADGTVRVDANLQGTEVEKAFAALADRLLLGDLLPAGEPALEGTRSLSARRAYLRGEVALDAWRLEVADSAFVEATERDTDYAAAQLRTALARQWRGVPATGWVVPAHQAEQRRHDLSPRDQEAARALVAEADGDLATACTIWRELTRSEDQDYAAWYGWARCQAADDAVVAEAGSPSGWAFRTSYHAALEAYQRAFRLNPSILTSYREESYAPLLGLFRLRSDVTRRGRTAPPDSRTFWADASWRGDSLAYVPYPDDSGSYALGSRSPDLDEAIRHLKETFRGLASAWVAASPRNADAHQALALAMAMMGDPSAIAILRTARDLAIDEAHRLEIMGWMAGMELALSVPADRGGVRRARAMADSVLQTGRDAAVSDRVLGSLAALTGRADLAVSYVTDPDASSSVFAAPLRRDAPALLVYAALGGPADSLAALERRVVTTIRDALLPTEQARALHEFLIRPATLAYPSHRLAAFDSLTDVDDYLWDLQAAWSSHDSVRVRQGLDRLRADRLQLLPGSITWDALYPEASLLTELGDPRAAADWLDPALNVLPQVVPLILRDAAHAGALARAFALRAVIADQLGDSLGAAHWARVVVTLWGDADPFLQPIVRRLGALAR